MTYTIGNLYPIIAQILEQNQPSLSFLQPQFTEYTSWQRQARNQLMALLRYNPVRVPLDSHTVDSVDCGDYTREKVYFYASPAARIPAYILIPKHLRQQAPAIVALHDHGGFYQYGKEKLVDIENGSEELSTFKREYYSGRSYATELAKQGYVVIATDAFFFGERGVDFDTIDADLKAWLANQMTTFVEKQSAYNRQAGLFEQIVARHIFVSGATWLGMMVYDDRVSVDYLVSRPEVDPTRIGCLGLSTGGHRTDYLVATDTRIKAAVTVGWMTNWRDLLPHYVRSHAWMQYVPGLESYLELSDVVTLGMPASLFVQECKRDALFPLDGMQRACENIGRIYDKAGLRDHYQYQFYDVPHQFNMAMQQDAFDWLDRWLK